MDARHPRLLVLLEFLPFLILEPDDDITFVLVLLLEGLFYELDFVVDVLALEAHLLGLLGFDLDELLAELAEFGLLELFG